MNYTRYGVNSNTGTNSTATKRICNTLSQQHCYTYNEGGVIEITTTATMCHISIQSGFMFDPPVFSEGNVSNEYIKRTSMKVWKVWRM